MLFNFHEMLIHISVLLTIPLWSLGLTVLQLWNATLKPVKIHLLCATLSSWWITSYGNVEDSKKGRSGDAVHHRRVNIITVPPLKSQHQTWHVIGFFQLLRGTLQGKANFYYVLFKSSFPKRVNVGNLEWHEGLKKKNPALLYTLQI